MKNCLTLPLSILLITIFSSSSLLAQPAYKVMMEDMSINFYDVCEEADAYFETHDKGKGSGYKGYQRWKSENESKYYPSGDRSNSDPNFAANSYKEFLRNNGEFSLRSSFDNGWRDLGPYDANTITSHYSPGIGRVESFWVNPANDQQIYLGSRSGGFWKTDNGGQTWVNTTDTLFASGVNTIAVSPTNPDSILINIRNGGNSTTHGIYRSIDGGDSWTLTDFNPTNVGWGGLGSNAQIYKIAYHPTIPDLIFVGTRNGIYHSDDNLQSWTQQQNSARITDIEFHPTNPDIIYLYDDRPGGANEDKILRSTDTGMSYLTSATIQGNGGATGFIAVTPQCDSCVFFASNNGVWASTDEGINFNIRSIPSQNCRGFAVSDIDMNRMIYGYVDLQSSSDGGFNFFDATDWSIGTQFYPDDYVHADLRTAECINGDFYVGTDGFLCKSTDNGSTWTRLNDGTGIREFYAAGHSQSHWKVAMAGSQDNGTSIIDQTGWIEWNGGDGMEALVQPLREDWMIGSWQYGTRNITRDAGQSRQGAGNPDGGAGNADWIAPLLMDPNQQMNIYHFSSSVYLSENFGDNNWQFISTPGIGLIRVAAIAENNSDIIAIARNAIFMISTDGGNNFNAVTGLPNQSITDIAFDPNDDSTLIVTYNRYQNDNQKVYISHNLGATWTNITGNLGNMPIRTVVIDHSNQSYIYLGAEIGVYYKPMNGTTWSLYNPNLPNCTVRDLEIQYGTNTLRAATWGRGLWEYTLENRNDHPSILTTDISEFPMLPAPAPLTDQYVTSVISYDGILSSAFVRWSVGQPTFDSVITMSNTIDSTWVSDTYIPHQSLDSDVYFKVFAVGDHGDTTETYKFHYTAAQIPPPPDTTSDTTSTGILESTFDHNILLYPNPSSGAFTVDLGTSHSRVHLQIHDLAGKLVYTSREQGQRFDVVLNEPAGVYFINLSTGTKNAVIRLVLE